MKYLAYLHSIGFTQSNLSHIFATHDDYENFFRSFTLTTLTDLSIKREKAETILKNREAMQLSMIDATLNKFSIRLVTIRDAEYPTLLKNISRPPYVIYVRGKLRDTSRLISIVGSRKHTKYAQTALEYIIPDLISSGFWVVSGWAYGVDALAHAVTVAHGGYTIAVLGTGVDLIYPAQNRELFGSILSSGGALVSIFPLSTRAEIYNFPIRNEIVAALSRGVIVGEAAEKSGTLITARLALEFDRDVFVIPGDITRPNSAGANALIRDGLGKLILSASDVLCEYDVDSPTLLEPVIEKVRNFDDVTEKSIFELLVVWSLDASEIARQLDIEASIVLYRCSTLEVKGYIAYSAGTYSPVL